MPPPEVLKFETEVCNPLPTTKPGCQQYHYNLQKIDLQIKMSSLSFRIEMQPCSASKRTSVNKKFGIQALAGPHNFQLAYIVMPRLKIFLPTPLPRFKSNLYSAYLWCIVCRLCTVR